MQPFPAKSLLLLASFVISTLAGASACKSEPEACGDIDQQADCDSAEGCGWVPGQVECVNTCSQITTQDECEAIERCVWGESVDEGDTGAFEGCLPAL